MLELQERKINKELTNTVNARELWQKLKSQRQFADWIKNRLVRFIENQDYICLSRTRETHRKMKNKTVRTIYKEIEYYLTLDTAKMICMLENNEIGDKIRRYFLTCEKELFFNKKERLVDIRERLNITDKIQELYGEKIEQNKINGIKDWTYSNYTCLVYKKVFGVNNATKVKKLYSITDKESLRDSHKLPREKKDEIREWEYSIHCYLQILKKQNTPVGQLYNKVREFLFGKQIKENNNE